MVCRYFQFSWNEICTLSFFNKLFNLLTINFFVKCLKILLLFLPKYKNRSILNIKKALPITVLCVVFCVNFNFSVLNQLYTSPILAYRSFSFCFFALFKNLNQPKSVDNLSGVLTVHWTQPVLTDKSD